MSLSFHPALLAADAASLLYRFRLIRLPLTLAWLSTGHIAASASTHQAGNLKLLPEKVHNAQHHLAHHACMESKEGSDSDRIKGYSSQHVSNNKEIMDNEEIHTARKHLEDIQHKALLAQENISWCTPGSTSTLQLLGNCFKGGEKKWSDVIVRACIAVIIGLLNVYTDNNLKYSWRTATNLVAKVQRSGKNHTQHIREWVMDFLRCSDLPHHQLNWKHPTIIDDEDITQEIKTCMAEKRAFLKAKDIVEIITSPELQGHFCTGGHYQSDHFCQNSASLAWEVGMDIWETKEWDVSWWAWEIQCC